MRFVRYRDHDAERIAAFYLRVHALDPHVGTTTPEAFRRYAALGRNHDGRDFELAEQDGELVALLLSSCPPGVVHRDVRVVVHPAHRRAGLGQRLVARAAAQAPHGRKLVSSVHAQAKPAVAFARALGFEITAHRVRMRRPTPLSARSSNGAVALPSGYCLRLASDGADDQAAWLELERRAFAGSPGYSPSTREDLAVLRRAPDCRVCFVEYGGRVVAMCHSTRFWGTQHAELLSVVVRPEHRRRGLGAALVADAIAHQTAAGASAVELLTEADNRPARALYSTLGFNTTAELLTYSGCVAPAPEAT